MGALPTRLKNRPQLRCVNNSRLISQNILLFVFNGDYFLLLRELFTQNHKRQC